jgi:hypothetical protein
MMRRSRLANAGRSPAGRVALDRTVPALLMKVGRYPLHQGSVGAVRTLGRLGVRVFAVTEDRFTPTARSRYLFKRFLWPTSGAEDPQELVAGMLAIGARIGARAVLLPTDDEAALLAASMLTSSVSTSCCRTSQETCRDGWRASADLPSCVPTWGCRLRRPLARSPLRSCSRSSARWASPWSSRTMRRGSAFRTRRCGARRSSATRRNSSASLRVGPRCRGYSSCSRPLSRPRPRACSRSSMLRSQSALQRRMQRR